MVLNLFSDNKPSKRPIWVKFCLCKNGFHKDVASEYKRFYAQINTPGGET